MSQLSVCLHFIPYLIPKCSIRSKSFAIYREREIEREREKEKELNEFVLKVRFDDDDDDDIYLSIYPAVHIYLSMHIVTQATAAQLAGGRL